MVTGAVALGTATDLTDGPDSAGRPRPSAPAGAGPLGDWLRDHPAWPVTALLAAYPLWWALGVADMMWIGLAVPMATRMLAWRAHGTRSLRLPPGFGLWLLFLVWTLASLVTISQTAPGTVPSAVSHRVISYADRTATYVALTLLLLYVGNLTEAELSKRKVAALLGLVGIYSAAFGIAGIIAPNFEFNSPMLASCRTSCR